MPVERHVPEIHIDFSPLIKQIAQDFIIFETLSRCWDITWEIICGLIILQQHFVVAVAHALELIV